MHFVTDVVVEQTQLKMVLLSAIGKETNARLKQKLATEIWFSIGTNLLQEQTLQNSQSIQNSIFT